MPLISPKEIAPRDRATYQRWMRGVLMTYGTILTLLIANAFYHISVASEHDQIASKSTGMNSDQLKSRTTTRQAFMHD